MEETTNPIKVRPPASVVFAFTVILSILGSGVYIFVVLPEVIQLSNGCTSRPAIFHRCALTYRQPISQKLCFSSPEVVRCPSAHATLSALSAKNVLTSPLQELTSAARHFTRTAMCELSENVQAESPGLTLVLPLNICVFS
jgi:hypothetical protein